MLLPPEPPSGHTPLERYEATPLIAAEDAALALFQLQLRIADLERENRLLRRCVADSSIATTDASVAGKPATSHHQPLQ